MKPSEIEKSSRLALNYAWIMRRFLGEWEPMSELPSASSIPRLAPPPQLYFVISAVFHYLGPAFAVLLFARVEPLGVAWLRIASAALIFAAWRRPWRHFPQLTVAARWNIRVARSRGRALPRPHADEPRARHVQRAVRDRTGSGGAPRE